MSYRVSVFGGSQPQPGDPVYQDALLLGKLLALEGYTLLNGGYIGTMEAVSRGATEAGGQVIGVTCDQIEEWRPVKANPWVTQEWHYSTLQERIFALIDNCDAFIALPGGVGTLTEISLAWNLLITRILAPRPLILVGPGWQTVIHQFITEQGDFIPESQRGYISLVPDIRAAFDLLRKLFSEGKY